MPQCAPLPYLAGSVIALGLLLGLWWLHDCALRRQARQLQIRMNDRLDARARRTCESIDILRQSVQGLILKVHGVAMRMPTHEPLRAMLDEALTQAEGMSWDENDLGCSPDARTDERELALMLSAFGERLRGWQGPECRVTVQGQQPSLNAGVGADLFAIGREAMLNAYTHARASQVLVLVTYRRRSLKLTVSDNGKGLTPGELAAAHRLGQRGVKGMRERAEGLGATLHLLARSGGGTEWRLTLPAAAAYLPAKNGCRRRWLR